MLYWKAGTAVALVMTAGCGNLNSIHHSFVPDAGSSISIDAKQRTVYTVEKIFRDPDEDRIRYRWRAICAEPSPDALTALSTSGGISAETLGKAVSGAFSGTESAASIGLRTQTIQLLRDAMYRLCEGYASGAIDNIGFARLQRRYQNIMMGLLAIEQLTGSVSARQVILSGSAEASVARSLAEVQAQLNDAVTVRRDAEDLAAKAATEKTAAEDAFQKAEKAYQDLKKANGDKDDVPAVKEAKHARDAAEKKATEAETRKENADKVLKDAIANVEAYQGLRNDLGKVATRTLSKGTFDGGSHVSLINSQTAETLSAAVKEIVSDIVSKDYSKETCMDAALSRDMLSFSAEQYQVAVQFCILSLQIESAQLAKAAATPEQKEALKSINATVSSIQSILATMTAAEQKRREEARKKREDSK